MPTCQDPTVSSPSPPSSSPLADPDVPDAVGWSLLLLTLVMGAALVATTWSGLATARDAGAALIREEGDALLRPIRSNLRSLEQRPPPASALEPHVAGADELEEGVTFVYTFEPSSGRTSHAGSSRLGLERVAQETLAAGAQSPLIVEDGVALLVKRLPPGPRLRARYPDRLIPREEFTRIAIEFTPHAAARLESAASRTLAVGAFATLLLLITSWACARLLRNRARVAQEMARDRRLAALGEMSVVLAHEIRNPLASLKGHAQLLAESLPDESRERAKTERIVGEALRLERLCAHLLEFVRSGKIEPKQADIAALIRESAEAVGEAEVELVLDEAPASWPLDELKMRQVLVNLLRNAAQASPAGAPVRVEARVEGPTLCLRVRDQGPGFTPGQETEIFQPFHTTRTQGTGLGLAVAQRVVELHGGTISARNHPEGGAELSVRLPRGRVPVSEDAGG